MKTKRFLSILLSLVLVLGMLPGMSLTAMAADTTTTITSPATTGTMTITLTIAEATHSVTITAGENMTTTGNASQTGLSGAMTNVVYTADDGYYFPTDYSVAEVNGITVTRDSFTQITVSGNPTADAEITLPAPTQKANQDAPTGLTATKASSSTAADGKISNVTDAMEYQKNDASAWTAVENNKTEITGLTSGTYKVRYKETADKNASPAANVEVGTKTDQEAPTGLTATKASSSTATDGKISGVTAAMEYQIDGATTWTAVGENKTEITGLTAGTYKVRYARTADKNASDATSVEVGTKTDQTAPAGLTATKASSGTAADGKISNVTDAMEYQKNDASAWTAVGENKTEITGLTTGTYRVRYAETADKNASPAATVEVGTKTDQEAPTGFTATKASSSTATDGKISNVTDAMEYQKNDASAWTAVGENKTEITGLTAGTYKVRYAGTADKNASSETSVVVGVKEDQTAPTGLTATKASSSTVADGKLSGVTAAMEYQIDGATTWTAVGENKTEITDLTAGTYKVRYAGTADMNASPATSVEVGVKEDQTAPTGLSATKASSSTATDGKISGVTSAMEYQKDGDSTWTSVEKNKTEITDLTAGTYRVRYAETANENASPATSVEVGVKEDQTAPTGLSATKASSSTATDGKISGVTAAMEYQIDGATTWTAVGENKTEITGLTTGTYKVRYAETADKNASDATSVEVGVKEDQTAPTGLSATKASSSTTTDGKISGVTAAMEYQKDGDTSWTAVGNGKTEITGLTAGTYKVRYAGTADKNASDATSVEVGTKTDQTAPTGLTATKASSSTATDGKISGVTAAMEYQKDGDTSWTAVGNGKTEITGLTAGTYKVRYAGTADKNSSPATSVVVGVKATQTITASDMTATYGDTDKSVSASVTDPAEGKGAISYAVKSGSENYIDVNASTGALTIKAVPPTDGKAYVIVTAAETDDCLLATKDVTVTISKADSTPATVTANNRTYDSTEKPLVTVTGTATGGTMQYALCTDDQTAPTKDWNEAIPAKTDAGTYYVWYKVIGDANHNDSEASFVEAKINPVDKKDLNNAIEEAEAYYNTIKVNSDYSEQKEALGSAISTAKLLAGNDNVTAAEVSEGITAVNSAKTTAETAVEGIIESNKEAFAAEKTTQKNNADSLAKDGDSDASRKLIEDAKKAIDAIDFDNTKTLDDNKAALADIITKLTDNLTTQRAADKLAADKAAFEVEKTTKQKAADALSEELDSDASKKLITDAKAAIEALTYDETKSLDENKAAIEAVITSLKTDLGTQRAEDLATNKEAFGADKETQKKAADALAADGDSDASKRLIEDAKKAIDESAYDETKSLDENKAALAAIVSKLKDELTAKRAEEKKDAADKAAADKVIEAINALPAKEDVTASDKEAVEAARAAYDALTASQKDKIDTATLQKLTDAEEALVALGELDKNVVAFNSEKNVQKAEAVKLAKEDDSDAVRKLIADAREAIDALAYDKNKSLDENKAVLAAIITELGNALEEQRELEKILAVVKIDQGETVAEVDKTAIKEEDVETVTNVAKSTDADLSEAATTCVKQIVEESETVEDSDKNIVIVPALDVKGKEYSVTETDATMTLDIEAVYTSYETTSDITTAADVKSATEAEDETGKAKVKEIGSGKLDTEGTPVNVKIEVPAAFAGVLGATTETVKASPATIYVKHTHKNKNYEYNASLYCEGSKYFVEFVNPNGFSPFTLSGNSASVASIGDKNYTDLQSAIDDAADGSTIKLTNDNDVSATINTEKTITIDKDNHTGNVDIKAADTLLLTKTDNEDGTTTYKTVTKYKVTFDNNGGKGTMPAQEIGGTAALNANAFTKEGYTFDGWNTKSDGSGTAYADKADVTPAADMTLYAQWKENPKPDDKDKTDAEVEAVKTKINALKAADKITTEDKAAIEAADKAYDALSEARKKLIDAATLKKLTDAKAALKAAEKAESDKAAADAVKTRINALKAADKITTTDKAAIEEARKAYDALSADQKKLVDAATLKKLTDAEKALTTAEANDKAAKELEAAKEEAQAAMNEQVTVTQKGNKFTVKWKKASSADGYYVYARYCGKKITKPEKIIEKNTTTKTVITKIGGKKINQKKNFRVYVAPYKIVDGKKVTLGKSMTAHLVGSKNTKYSNVKKLTLTKSKYTVKVGKTAKIKAKVTLVNKNKKHIPKSHGAKFRYKSSDTSIATVDKNGKVKGIRKGTCTIYVYSINGLMKKAKVTVK